jgi:tyrosyl-tRNA synthetase
MYGKLMKVTDPLMVRYYELLTEVPADQIAAIKSGEVHPMQAKKRLARTIVTEYHGEEGARAAEAYFEAKFQRREVPSNVQVYRLNEPIWICELVKQLGFTSSTTEARRLLSQGAVRVDGQAVSDVNFRFVPGEHKILEVGKRRVARIEP